MCALFLLAAMLPGVRAVAAGLGEYEVKAAFLYNFAKFVSWPGTDGSLQEPFVIGVFGRDPFGPILERTIGGKTAHGHPLVLKRISETALVGSCRILFVGATETNRVPEILRAARGNGVLTIGESDEFLRKGGMIKLMLVHNRVRFAVNAGAARASGLKISSQLLKLATDVTGSPRSLR